MAGRLLADLHPNGTVRLVFLASIGGGNEIPLTAKNLDTAKIDFVRTCVLSPERAAAALRAEMERNKVSSVQASIHDAVTAKFRYVRPHPESACVLAHVPA